jgi:hypothetical protein
MEVPTKDASFRKVRAVTVAIGLGENRGKTITYQNVARRWVKLGTWAGKAAAWNVPMQELDIDGIDEAAVMVQSQRRSARLQATRSSPLWPLFRASASRIGPGGRYRSATASSALASDETINASKKLEFRSPNPTGTDCHRLRPPK